MKTQINLLAACFLFASVLIVPQANAVTPPCTPGSLTGPYGYELRGSLREGTLVPPASTSTDDARVAVGLITFNGAGGLTYKFSETIAGVNEFEFLQVRWDGEQGTYTINPDCTGTLILHDSNDAAECVHFDFALRPTPVALGSLVPTGPTPPPNLKLVFLVTDGTLTCTDRETFVPASGPSPGFPHGKPPRFVSSYTGTITSVL